jgi:uncharacterized membrane protein YbhN (UPF0104 family)
VIDPQVGAGREREMSSAKAGRRKLLVHGAFGAVGLVALGLLVHGVGAATLFAIVRASARWIPVLFAIDALRVVTEAAATWSFSERVRRRVPLAELARVHLVGYAIAMVMPAGRAAAEAVKAAMLSRFVGVPHAAAIGATNQTTSFLGSVLVGVVCVLASLALTGLSPIFYGVLAFTIATLVLFTLVQLALRRRDLSGALLKRFAKAEQTSASFQDAIAEMPVVPLLGTLMTFLNRLVVVVELGLLLFVLGGKTGVLEALLAQSVSLVAGTIGDLVPGQLGASDGAFALAARYLGVAAATGIAISVLLHCVQMIWAVIGWTVPFVWKAPREAAVEEARAPLLLPAARVTDLPG